MAGEERKGEGEGERGRKRGREKGEKGERHNPVPSPPVSCLALQ